MLIINCFQSIFKQKCHTSFSKVMIWSFSLSNLMQTEYLWGFGLFVQSNKPLKISPRALDVTYQGLFHYILTFNWQIDLSTNSGSINLWNFLIKSAWNSSFGQENFTELRMYLSTVDVSFNKSLYTPVLRPLPAGFDPRGQQDGSTQAGSHQVFLAAHLSGYQVCDGYIYIKRDPSTHELHQIHHLRL